MKLTILGSSAAYAGKNEGCSSSHGDFRFLIDTGPGCVSTMQNYMSFSDISGIFLSHLHADHTSDIYTLRYAVFTAQRDGYMMRGIPIYMPLSPKTTFRFIRETVEEELDIHEITEKTTLDLHGMKVRFLKTRHPVDTFAIRFEHTDGCIVYTADTALFEGLVSFCSDADLLLAEATLQNRDREMESMGHMTAETTAGLARDARVKRLILTHIWPPYDKKTSSDEAQTVFPGPISIAERGAEYTM
jgi:ribonuclease BN (tRNA processing enzyme)